jgi:hypothetical protein
MKIKYVLIFFILVSCSQSTKKVKDSNIKVEDALDTAVNVFENTDNVESFSNIISKIKTQSLPLIETTNFDTFIDEDDYNLVDVKALKLENIYKNFNKKGYNFRAIRSYKIELSKHFYSAVVTIIKGENEMESVLINYDLKGQIIDSEVVSYDEIAEGWLKIESKIEKNRITTNYISWVGETKKVETSIISIEENGQIEHLSLDKTLIDKALQQLNLDRSKVKTDLLVTKENPNNPEETILVIPEIVEQSSIYVELNSHILIINSKTGIIQKRYFESSATNEWFSDAIQLVEISIDTAPYNIANNKRAFGIKVRYVGSSQANPYEKETISLFIEEKNTLKQVLKNFTIISKTGEWDTACAGEFNDEDKILIIDSNLTNNYYDILGKTTITHSVNYVNENENCESEINIEKLNEVLKFNNGLYLKEN